MGEAIEHLLSFRLSQFAHLPWLPFVCVCVFSVFVLAATLLASL